ncbi:hypothetical protein PENSPDRAFT_687312 [Peniophora sp. CONT]|nr:hypothetical protein PENSPDRAFT_687312 [Peniophora sp. CONT]
MSGFESRRAAFKLPPSAMLDKTQTQSARRAKALEEQKRRRAERIESERHIDLFADLKLGNSDDEDENGEPEILQEGIGHLASMVQPASEASGSADAVVQPEDKKKRRKKKKKRISPWADQVMYAELLEMTGDASRREVGSLGEDIEVDDGLPTDLESAWVAVAPVPAGKRCLAICHQGSGAVGVVPNTTLRSRVLGKPLMARFPSPLPSDTVLDCILDENWQETGALHVLDVLRWKGQEVADCETTFRMWWRDTRLSELPPPRPPPNSSNSGQYQFAYPTAFLPISWSADTTSSYLLSTVIPHARQGYDIPVMLPPADDEMDLDGALVKGAARVRSDGLLLYVASAIYEPGTSPLSLWVPNGVWRQPVDGQRLESMEEDSAETPMDVFERLVKKRVGFTA